MNETRRALKVLRISTLIFLHAIWYLIRAVANDTVNAIRSPTRAEVHTFAWSFFGTVAIGSWSLFGVQVAHATGLL